MSLADLALLALRLVVGLTFAAHGAQKAFGWWNGPGYQGWQKAMEGMRFQPAPLWALASIGAELVGGLLVAIGLFTPIAVAVLVAQSVVIILKVHLPNGFWNSQKGYEYPLTLMAALAAILGVGAGRLSLDAAIGLSLDAFVLWLLLAAGALAGIAAYGLTQAQTDARTAPQQR